MRNLGIYDNMFIVVIKISYSNVVKVRISLEEFICDIVDGEGVRL